MKHALLLAAALSTAASAHALRPDFNVTYRAGNAAVSRLYTADFNLDGRPDLVTRNNQHSVLVSLLAADATAGPLTNVFTGTYVTHHVVGDFDEDGDPDIVVSDTTLNTVTLLPSNGDGTFGTPVASALTFSPTEIDAGDFNNDGHLDLAARSYSASCLAVLAGDGDGAFAEVSRRTLAVTAYQTALGDVDGDGKLDAAIVHDEPNFYEIHYGRNDGTFDPAVTTASAGEFMSDIVIADLDGDGDRELVSAEFTSSTVTIVFNQGARSLAAPQTYEPISYADSYGSAYSVVVGDFNEDTHADVAVAMANDQLVAVMPGDGNGGFGLTAVTSIFQRYPLWMVTADFNGDGKLDIAATTTTSFQGGVVVMTQDAGQVDVTLSAEFPTVTQGQAARFPVRAAHPYDNFFYGGGGYPRATGTVTLKEGSTVIASGPLDSEGVATLDVTSLGIGTHTLTAHYSGDSNYRSMISEAVTQKVIAESTTTTISSSSAPVIPYGSSIDLVADVTSPVAAPLDGTFRFYRDGTAMDYYGGGHSGPPASTTYYATEMGTHSFHVTYSGNADQPPSQSGVLQRTVRKATTTTTWWGWASMIAYEGQGSPSNISIDVDSETGHVNGTGTVQIYDGPALVHTTTPGTYFQVPPLAPGVHYLRAVYTGTANYEPSSSALFKYTVLANGSFFLDTYRQAGSNWLDVNGYYAGGGVSYYRRYQKINNGPWTMTQSFSSSDDVSHIVAGAVYSFRMEAYNASNQLLATSNLVTYVNLGFTDDPLMAGTFVKAVHLQELLNSVNLLRGAAGLGSMSLADFGVGYAIRASHLQAIRTAINEARVALGGGALAFNTGVVPGGPMQVIHIHELRDAVY